MVQAFMIARSSWVSVGLMFAACGGERPEFPRRAPVDGGEGSSNIGTDGGTTGTGTSDGGASFPHEDADASADTEWDAGIGSSGDGDASSSGGATSDDETAGSGDSSAPPDGAAEAGCGAACEPGSIACLDGVPHECEEAKGCSTWVVHAACETCEVPGSVEPLSPMRGAYTGSLHAPSARGTLRPTLEWTDSSVECGDVSYQVQMDDSCVPGELESCSFETAEIDVQVDGTSFRPPADLPVAVEAPVGALYAWRVRACTWGTQCSSWSSVAYLHVGRTEQDLNGDGYADVVVPVVSADGEEGFDVYQGGRNFNGIVDAHVPLEYFHRYEPRFVGDINADGFGDIAFIEGANALCSSTGLNVALLHGASDVDGLSFDHLCRTAGSPSVSLGVTHAGDLDGDGFADLPVARDLSSTENSIYFLSGGVTIATTPTVELDTRTGAPYAHTEVAGVAMAGAGDFNGDSYADLLTVGGGVTEDVVVGRLYLGAAELNREFTQTIEYAEDCNMIVWLARLGDVTDDGKDDWALSCEKSNPPKLARFGLLPGGTMLPTSLVQSFTSETKLTAVSPALDFDNDGTREVFVGGESAQALIWRQQDFDADNPPQFSDLMDVELLSVADHDGDGRGDVAWYTSTGSVQWVGSHSSFNVVPVYFSSTTDFTPSGVVF